MNPITVYVVYVVLEDARETTVKLVTTNIAKVHLLVNKLLNEPDPTASVDISIDGPNTIYACDYYIRVERVPLDMPDVVGALERLTDRVEELELPNGSTPDTLDARMTLLELRKEGD